MQVTITLIDFECSESIHSRNLLKKFTSQQFNLCKWFRKRDEFMKEIDQTWGQDKNPLFLREFHDIPLEFFECRQVQLKAVSKNCQIFIDHSHGSFPEWKFDRELLKKSFQASGAMIHYGDSSLTSELEIVEEAAKFRGFTMIETPHEFMNKEFVLKVLERNPVNINFISNNLINDPDVIIMAAKDGMLCPEHEGKFNDKSYARIIVKANGNNIQQLPIKLRHDREIIEIALSQNGLVLEHCSLDTVTASMVKIAVKQNGLALQFSSKEIRDNYDIVVLAVNQNGLSLKYASERLRSDKNIAKMALSQNALAIEHVINVCCEIKSFQEKELKNMREDMLLKTLERTEYIKHLPHSLLNDIKFVEKAILVNPQIFYFLPYQLQTDEDIILKALSTGIVEFNPNILESEEFLFKCFQISSSMRFFHKLKPCQLSDREFIKRALSASSKLILDHVGICSMYKQDREMQLHALKQDPCIAIRFLEFIKQEEVAIELARCRGLFCETTETKIPYEVLRRERFNYEYENMYLTLANRKT